MHNSTDENYHRGYEWWLMKEAKQVQLNAVVMFSCLCVLAAAAAKETVGIKTSLHPYAFVWIRESLQPCAFVLD